jgi:hypothetical protein
MVKELPDQRVYRPQTPEQNLLINRLMEFHELQGDIPKSGWTNYIDWLINRDLAEVRSEFKHKFSRLGG